jgi:hypothetical protein
MRSSHVGLFYVIYTTERQTLYLLQPFNVIRVCALWIYPRVRAYTTRKGLLPGMRGTLTLIILE